MSEAIDSKTHGFRLRYRALMDKLTIYPKARWASLAALLVCHFWRVYYLSIGKEDWQFAVVTYVLGLSWVNHFFLYLSPAQSLDVLENERLEREAIKDLESLR